MRVLQVISNLERGGAENMLHKIMSSLVPRGHKFMVVSLTQDGPIGERIRSLGVETRFLGMARGVPNPLALGRLLGVVRGYRPDVIQTWMYHADLMGGLCGKACGIPVIWGIRTSMLDPRKTKRTTLLARWASARLSSLVPSAIVSCSRTAAAQHIQLGYSAERTLTIPNGFDLAAFRPSPEHRRAVRQELGIPEEAPIVGMIARLDPKKDHATFFGAASLTLRRRGDVHFLLAGRGLDEANPRVRQWAADTQRPSAFHLLGERGDSARLDAALDIGTISSAYGEGFPNTIGEAMACGVPCVVTDTGDSAWLVSDTGRVVSPGDAAALSRAWLELLDLAAEDRQRLGVAARQRMESEFSIAAVADQFAETYRRVLGLGREAAGRLGP